MTDGLRPCSNCRRHARVDETRCPFCGADLDVMPVMAERFGDERRVPAYGAPPLRNPAVVLPALITFGLGIAIAVWLSR